MTTSVWWSTLMCFFMIFFLLRWKEGSDRAFRNTFAPVLRRDTRTLSTLLQPSAFST